MLIMRGELRSHYESIMEGEGRGGWSPPKQLMKIRNLEKLRARLIVFFQWHKCKLCLSELAYWDENYFPKICDALGHDNEYLKSALCQFGVKTWKRLSTDNGVIFSRHRKWKTCLSHYIQLYRCYKISHKREFSSFWNLHSFFCLGGRWKTPK